MKRDICEIYNYCNRQVEIWEDWIIINSHEVNYCLIA